MAKSNLSVFIKDEPIALYAQLTSPGALKHKKTADPSNPLVNKEYIVELLLKKKELKLLRKKYKKTVKLLQYDNVYTSEEYEKRFKVAPPTDPAYETIVEEMDDDDNEYTVTKYETIKVRKHASYNDGGPTRLVDLKGCKNGMTVDRNGVAITQQYLGKDGELTGESTLIGNGSVVKVQLTVRDLNTDNVGDQQFDLFAIQVLNLVVYESSVAECGFSDEEGDDVPVKDVDAFGDEDEGGHVSTSDADDAADEKADQKELAEDNDF